MKRQTVAAFAVVVACLAGVAAAQEKADPTGTWKWSVTFGDQTREQTVKLKLEGDKLTGTMLGRDNQETPIEEASFKDGTVAFTVVREREGQKFTTKYSGKLSGDTIKGTRESTRDGQAQSREWEAKKG